MKTLYLGGCLLIATVCTALLAGCPPPNAFHTITLGVTPAASGVIYASPDQASYIAGTEVTLQAVPNPGWAFSRWVGTGINTTMPATRVLLRSNQRITAVFVPVSDSATNLLADGSFELGPTTDAWTQTSDNFQTLICDISRCGRPNGLGPQTGLFWAFFGGTETGLAENATISQRISLPEGGNAVLEFSLAVAAAEGPLQFRALMDADILFELTDAEADVYQSYRQVRLSIPAFADGATHTLRFEYSNPAAPGAAMSVLLDDVSLFVEEDSATLEPVVIAAPQSLPSGSLGQGYEFRFTATGGTAPYIWALGDIGAPPAGILLTSGGSFRGIPARVGDFTFEVIAIDASGTTASGFFTMTVMPLRLEDKDETDG